MSEDWTWAQWALGAAGAVVLPLIMRRIFFHKRARIASSAGSGSLEEYMTNVRCHLHQKLASCGLTHHSAPFCCFEQHGMSELDAKFQVAVDFIATKGNKLTNEQVWRLNRSVEMGHATDSNPMRLCTQRLTLYAFYKQAHFGKCSIDKPSAADFIGSAKWYVHSQESA